MASDIDFTYEADEHFIKFTPHSPLAVALMKETPTFGGIWPIATKDRMIAALEEAGWVVASSLPD